MEEHWPKLVPEICVSNLEKSLDFYLKNLGFKMKYGRPEEGFAYLDKEGSHIMLEEVDENGGQWITGELEKPFGRGINFQIEISNVDELYKELKKADYKMYREIKENWYRTGDVMGGNKEFLIQDPDGYLLRFFTHLGNKPVD